MRMIRGSNNGHDDHLIYQWPFTCSGAFCVFFREKSKKEKTKDNEKEKKRQKTREREKQEGWVYIPCKKNKANS
jgi:hypothetical protein